ncbi:MAG: 50S ribosomal protein L25/general stress protein Ctc [Alphaproteobacteria bacterium]|nr:50S ribosomal protein L25/general stress protein Ctc [Alphaproteobacteria bacterium]
MSNHYAFKAAKRDGAGKGTARALRREGRVPAVIYGDNKEPLNISIPANDINVEYNKGRMRITLCDMNVDGETHLVLARDIQLHPVTDIVLHADFLRVTDKTKIAVAVPVQLINEDKCPGIRNGGVLDMVRFRVELYCSAMNIPEFIEVDMEGKEIGDTAKISDAKLPEGVKPVIEGRNFAIANIAAPKAIEEPVVEAEEGTEGEAAEGEAAEGGDAPAEGGEEAKEEGGE